MQRRAFLKGLLATIGAAVAAPTLVVGKVLRGDPIRGVVDYRTGQWDMMFPGPFPNQRNINAVVAAICSVQPMTHQNSLWKVNYNNLDEPIIWGRTT